jgi:superfamily II DNA or RNA helicase
MISFSLLIDPPSVDMLVGPRERVRSHRSSQELDEAGDNPVNAIVSVLMLREGWDVRNVTVVVGLRPYTAKANVLPEQTIGRAAGASSPTRVRGSDWRPVIEPAGGRVSRPSTANEKGKGHERDHPLLVVRH